MSQLVAISFDVNASPGIRLKAHDAHREGTELTGWGFGWYPSGEPAAAIVKDPGAVGDTVMARVLREWDRFRGATFLCHIRGDNRVNHEDTHPFVRSYGGRDWMLAHDGDLDPAALAKLEFDDSVYEPVGCTDSERVFCILLDRMRREGARTLEDLGYERLHKWLQELDSHGTLNLLFCDGRDLIAYQDADGLRPLSFRRNVPPHDELIGGSTYEVDLSDPLDSTRTSVLIGTEGRGEGWSPLPPGGMLVLRRGQVRHKTFGEVKAPKRAPVLVDGPSLFRESRIIRVLHETIYQYEVPVEHSTHEYRLRPVHDQNQELLNFSLQLSPDGDTRSFDDVFGNRALGLRLTKPYTELRIRAESRVRIYEDAPLTTPFRRTTIPLVWMPWQRQMMLPYLLPPELPETQLQELNEFAMSFAERQDGDLVETLQDMNRTIRRDFVYKSGSTTLATTPFDVYMSREGVCQDFANLFICMARLLNIPARYRVGYIYTGGRYDNDIQSDASHAWVELYLPWIGWRGFDPTNGVPQNLDHVRVAHGRNYRDATPSAGTIFKGGAGEKLSITVRLEVED